MGSAGQAGATGRIAVGDGKISTTEAKRGYVYSCVTPRGGGGAFADGPWLQDGTWDPGAKLHVAGEGQLSGQHTFTVKGDVRSLVTNDLPDHVVGQFPIAESDPAYAYDRNPNTISAQDLDWEIPVRPTKAAAPSCLPMGAIGMMTSGSVLFNALDGEGRDAAAHEILDRCDGHPERSGTYHYHSLSSCLGLEGASGPQVVGWALDGFPIVAGNRGGKTVTNADLDRCHGTTATVTVDGSATRTYVYWMTREYPYSLGCFMGTAASTGPASSNGAGQSQGMDPRPGMDPGSSGPGGSGGTAGGGGSLAPPPSSAPTGSPPMGPAPGSVPTGSGPLPPPPGLPPPPPSGM